MDIQRKRDFLVNLAYFAVIAAAVYLAFQYLLPISVPFIIGILIARLVVKLSKKIHCSNKPLRILMSLLIYGIIGLLITLLVLEIIKAASAVIPWLPQLYEEKLLPFVMLIYNWSTQNLHQLDPSLISILDVLLESALSAIKNLISFLSTGAVNLVSYLATGVPNLILSLLATIFSTVFVVGDYEKLIEFTKTNLPGPVVKALRNIRIYLTDTLFVVIRSYALIMLLTFTELCILFSLFGVHNGMLKAALIAMLDILPILGTGGIMIPWAIVTMALGNTAFGLKLLLIYGIVTVIRNYVEPRIVGTQLGLHPIITLFSMFIGLRLFGFWGLFGLPVGISFLWKLYKEGTK